jgi:hypothetical protein
MIWALAALATFRLTRLVTADWILSRPREWVQARFETLGYLAGCAWCASMWIAPGPALLASLAPSSLVVQVLLGVPALSAVAGLLASVGREE